MVVVVVNCSKGGGDSNSGGMGEAVCGGDSSSSDNGGRDVAWLMYTPVGVAHLLVCDPLACNVVLLLLHTP